MSEDKLQTHAPCDRSASVAKSQKQRDADAKRLRKIRDERGETQAVMAAHIGVTERAYQYYERGERPIPPCVFKLLAMMEEQGK